jgi:hypothetical protein
MSGCLQPGIFFLESGQNQPESMNEFNSSASWTILPTGDITRFPPDQNESHIPADTNPDR